MVVKQFFKIYFELFVVVFSLPILIGWSNNFFSANVDIIPSTCTPGVAVFTATIEAEQAFLLPANCTQITIKMWGGGGGAGFSTASILGGSGGGAAYVEKVYAGLTPLSTFIVRVGQGGDAGGSEGESGSGGGYSGVFLSGTPYAVAAGGGGGGGAVDTHLYGGNGGAGGGSTDGEDGETTAPVARPNAGGKGATTTSGGNGGDVLTNGSDGASGTNYQGGIGAYSSSPTADTYIGGGRGGRSTAGGGGGGGGGYFGGGGGASASTGSFGGAGGGGGSSYLDGVGGNKVSGSGYQAGNQQAIDGWVSNESGIGYGTGMGGLEDLGTSRSGANGRVMIFYQ